MVWQNIFGRLNRSSQKSAKRLRERKLRLERMERRVLLASDLGAISGVAFVDQNGDGLSAGEPAVFVDLSGDLVAPGTPGALGISVQLFEDTNTDGSLDINDLLIGTATTDNNGSYRFDQLTVGTYFLVQQTVPQLNTPASQTVQVTNASGVQAALIDDYSTTLQSVTALANATTIESSVASEAIGGARDIEVQNTAATGQITVFIDNVSDTMSAGSLGDGVGTARIQYDGNDASIALDATGLNSVSLAGGAAADPVDPGAGLIIQSRAESAGDTLVITIYTDAANSSVATISIPQDATNFIETLVRFGDFVTATGTGANFNDVGAIDATLSLSTNNDVFVSIVESRRPDIVQADLANVVPVTLGGQLFLDNSAVGQNNGIREGTEGGLVAITVDLYALAAANDVVDPTTATPVASATTTAGGNYSFPGLDPGHYAVVVPSNQFQGGAALFGFANSTGNDPASDPDDNIDNDDNGTTLPSGDVVSGTITLVSDNEPTNDDDTDPNTNTTVDFGFFPQTDLQITKTENAAGSSIVAGGNVVFDIVVENLGPLDATNVVVQDIFPSGLTYTGNQNASGSFTVSLNGSTVSIDMGTIPAGTTTFIQLLADIGANQTSNITNTATVTGFEVDTDLTNNSESEQLDLVSSDLRIEKTDLTDPVTAGNSLVYEITVTNDGPDAAAGVVVVDTLPSGVSFVSGDVDGDSGLVSFDSGTGEVTATVGALANQASSVITITVDVPTNASTSLSNTATVTASPDSDPDSSNNTTTEDTAVERLVDVAINKSVTGEPIAGQDITYTFQVTNSGPSEASGISVTDTLDADLSFVSLDAGTSGVTVSQNGQDLTFDVGILDAGATATFSIDVTIDAGAAGNISNAATVATTDTDTNGANDTGSIDITAESRVDLNLVKGVDLATAVPGQDQLVYTFVVSHGASSISDAANVVITDTIPAGLTGVLITAPGATSTDFDTGTGVVTVTYSSIPNSETRTFTVTADVQEDATGTVTNSGTVTSSGTELDSTDNNDSASTVLAPDFDVVVTKVSDVTSPFPTDTVTYTVTVENEGPSTAPNVILSDTIPVGLTLVSATLEGQNGTSDGTSVTFPSITLDASQTATATLVFTVDAASSGTITNTASVPDLSNDGENDNTNNSDSVDITITAEADLGITKTVSTNDAQTGAELTYTMIVTNNGPSQAIDVVLVDTLPSGVTFISGTGPNGESLSAVGGVVTVDAGALADSATFTVTIIASIDSTASGDLINNASVSSAVADATPGNNAAAATTSVDPETSTIGGFVYVDANNDGIRDSGEVGIAGVQITLSGNDSLGNAVSQVVVTDASGSYVFQNLARGTYEVAETQPIEFRNGITSPGTGASAIASDNLFTELGLATDTDAIEFNFGERNPLLSKRLFLASS